MANHNVQVKAWSGDDAPTEAMIRNQLAAEGGRSYRWSNGPGDVYSVHTHHYHKVIYVLDGSITFGLPSEGNKVELHAGDRMDLPAQVPHDAIVGPQGVVCLEAHR